MRFGALALLCACSVPLTAQAPRELSADDAVRVGLESNARIRAIAADARAARAAADQVRAGLRPSVSSQANYMRLGGNIPDVTFTIPGTDSTVVFQGIELNRYHAELSVAQPILTNFRLRHEARAAVLQANAAEEEANQARADVAFEIRSAYWELQRALAIRASLADALAQVDAHLANVRNRFEEGTVLMKDVLAAQTRRSEVQLDIVGAENAVRVGQLELNRLLGLPLDTPVRPASDASVADTAIAPLAALTADAISRRPALNALTERVAAFQAQLRAARGQRFPELDFIGRYVYARPNPYFFAEQDRFHSTWELGFNTRWDIFQGGRRGAAAREAEARLAAAEARLDDARAEATVDVARRRLEIVRATEAVSAAAQNVREAEESFRVARQQYDEGAALSSDVLEAEQALRAAYARRAESLSALAIARAALLHSLGRTW